MKFQIPTVVLASLLGWRAPTTSAFVPLTPSMTKTSLQAATAMELPSLVESSSSVNAATQSSSVEFPPPLSRFDRFLRAASFWSTSLPIVANYYILMARIAAQNALGTSMTDEQIEELWNAQHHSGATKLADSITQLKGFYVKSAQIISTRFDLFPEQYTEALSGFTDSLDPMPFELVKAIVQQELLHHHEAFEDVFLEFDTEPLGSASVAQVHRAVLAPSYGGPRQVAVKIQRPAIEAKLMGDVANLKAITKVFRNALPLDYYTVFDELESQLAEEFDFVAEAAAMERIRASLLSDDSVLPVVLPQPVGGLVTPRVLVMDYLQGVPLSRVQEEMKRRGVDPNSPEAQLFGRNLLTALTKVFGQNILGTGYFHADPHPGNIFVLDDGSIGLIDFGQMKQISGRSRETLAKVMIALDEYRKHETPEGVQRIGELAVELGVDIKDDAGPYAAAAIAMWLFDGTFDELPGGYDTGELDPNSPVTELKSFPQDLVLVGRSAILIKAISTRLGIPWSLASEWAPIAETVLNEKHVGTSKDAANRVRFQHVLSTFKQWGRGKAKSAVGKLPSPLRTRVASVVVKAQERKASRKLRREGRQT